MLDTGTEVDVCRAGMEGEREVRRDIPGLKTGGGKVQRDTVVSSYLPELGENADFIELDDIDAPNALVIGARCAKYGYCLLYTSDAADE